MRKGRCIFVSLFLALVAIHLAITATLVAQTSRGTVTGTVRDPQGASVADAKIELHNRETNQTRSTTTNESGIYRFDAVELGVYDLTTRATGFKAFIKHQIRIVANHHC